MMGWRDETNLKGLLAFWVVIAIIFVVVLLWPSTYLVSQVASSAIFSCNEMTICLQAFSFYGPMLSSFDIFQGGNFLTTSSSTTTRYVSHSSEIIVLCSMKSSSETRALIKEKVKLHEMKNEKNYMGFLIHKI